MQPHGLTKHLQKTDFLACMTQGVAGVLAFSVHTVADCRHHDHSYNCNHNHDVGPFAHAVSILTTCNVFETPHPNISRKICDDASCTQSEEGSSMTILSNGLMHVYACNVVSAKHSQLWSRYRAIAAMMWQTELSAEYVAI